MNSRKALLSSLYEGSLTQIDALLTREPDLLKNINRQGRSELYSAATRGAFAAIEHVFNHNAFHVLGIHEQREVLREVINGGLEHAIQLQNNGKPDEAIQALEKIILFNKKIFYF